MAVAKCDGIVAKLPPELVGPALKNEKIFPIPRNHVKILTGQEGGADIATLKFQQAVAKKYRTFVPTL